MALDDDRIREGHVQSIRSQLQLEKADAGSERDTGIQSSGTSVTPFDSSGGHLYREIDAPCASRGFPSSPLPCSPLPTVSLRVFSPFSP